MNQDFMQEPGAASAVLDNVPRTAATAGLPIRPATVI